MDTFLSFNSTRQVRGPHTQAASERMQCGACGVVIFQLATVERRGNVSSTSIDVCEVSNHRIGSLLTT